MSDKVKKKLIWTNLFWITSIGIGFFPGHYTYWGIIKPAVENNEAKTKPEANDMQGWEVGQVIYSSGETPNLALPTPEETEVEKPEDLVETQKEAERLANWEANFPYKPTTDPDVVITEEMLEEGYGYTPIFSNHASLRRFFETDLRFTPRFEQLYHILEEHGRGDNPVATGNIFECLRQYHLHSQKDPEGQSGSYDHIKERFETNAEAAEGFFESIVYALHAERKWPDREFMPEDEAVALRDRIINEVQWTDKLPSGPEDLFAIYGPYVRELEVGDSPLVISPGWQAAYEEKYPPTGSEAAIKRMLGVDENNVLLDNGQPIEYREGENIAALITPDGIEVPLLLDDNGNVIIPTPAEIEEMIENGEGKYVEIPDENANQPPRYITEEEWKIQEALRQVEEAARQQE